MIWEAIPKKERVTIQVPEQSMARAKCQCGCRKFALIVEAGFAEAEGEWRKSVGAQATESPVSKVQWQLVCLNCKQRHV